MTFWGNKTCGPGFRSRCNGDFPGQCAGAHVECLDGSDKLEPLQDEGDCGEKLKCKARQSLQVKISRFEIVSVNKGDEVCLDKKLKCDLHPQCQGGEDELLDECNEAYKKLFSKDQTFICPNPYHEVTLQNG